MGLTQQKTGGLPSAGLNPSPSSGNGPTFSTPTADQTNDAVFQAGANAVTGVAGDGNFNVWRYPQDIATAEIPHYVMFYATVRKSDLSAAESKNSVSPLRITLQRCRNNAIPQENNAIAWNIDREEAFEAAQQLFGKSILGLPFALGAVVPLTAAATSSKAFQQLLPSREKYLIKDVVAMYLSGKPSSTIYRRHGPMWTLDWQDQFLIRLERGTWGFGNSMGRS